MIRRDRDQPRDVAGTVLSNTSSPSLSSAPPASQDTSQAPSGPLQDSIPVSALPDSIASELDPLCREYRRLGGEIKDRQDRQAILKEDIESILLSFPAKQVVGSGWKTNRKQKTSSFINPNKLIEFGVEIEAIEYATEEKKGREYIEILESEVTE